MGILGIENRTENWKTASHFAPFIGEAGAENRGRLARHLTENHEEQFGVQSNDAELELFWFGMRDYAPAQRGSKRTATEKQQDYTRITEMYRELFSGLRHDIEQFDTSHNTKLGIPHRGYRCADMPDDNLGSNVEGTEIDIVLKTESHLFIGEAKSQTASFRRSPSYVLVHQLIRQYVTARICENLNARSQGSAHLRIVPFVVVNMDKWNTFRSQEQIKFMFKQGWLKEANILTWETVAEISK